MKKAVVADSMIDMKIRNLCNLVLVSLRCHSLPHKEMSAVLEMGIPKLLLMTKGEGQ